MSYFTYSAIGRPGFEQLGVVAYHDKCVPEEIRHHTFNPPIVHVDLGGIELPGYWSHAPGWLWANWRAGYPCAECGEDC